MKGVFGHISLLSLGTVLGQAFTFLTTPILTRLYAPESYAVWALVFTTVSLVGLLATLRYEIAIVLPESLEEGAAVFLLAVGISLAVSGSVWVFFSWLPSLFSTGIEDFTRWVPWIAVLVLVMGVTQACYGWCTRRQYFRLLASSTLLLNGLSFLGQWVLFHRGYGDARGLIWGTVVGQVGSALILLAWVLMADRALFLRVLRTAPWVELAYRYRVYPLYMTPFTLLGVLRERVSVYLLGIFGTPHTVGYYALSTRVLGVPNSILASSIRPVLYQRAAAGGVASVEAFVFEVLNLLLRVGVPLLLVFIFYSEDVMAFVFGAQWRPAGPYAAVLSIPLFCTALGGWMDRLFDLTRKQKRAFQLELVFSILSAAAFLFGWWIFQTVLSALVVQTVILTSFQVFWIATIFQVSQFSLSPLKQTLFSNLGVAAGFGLLLVVGRWFLTLSSTLTVFSVVYAIWLWMQLRRAPHRFRVA